MSPAPSSPTRSTTLRWAVPAGVAAVVVGGVLVAPQLASADPELPPTTAADLLVDLATAPEQPFSGTVVQTTDLGLPELPTAAGAGSSSSLTSLLTGSTTLRVWHDGPERSRVAVMGSLSETDVVRDGQDLWLWESEGNTATRTTLPAGAGAGTRDDVPGTATPQELAEKVVAALDPSTVVRLDGTAQVAGRAAYQLVLEPRDEASLVGEVRLAVDADTSLPLSVQVTARGASGPALETGFTDVSFDRPGDEVFTFTPPPGATVTERPLPADGPTGRPDASPPAVPAGAAPSVVGEGWTAVTVVRGVDRTAVLGALAGGQSGSGGSDGTLEAVLGGFTPVSGGYGTGQLLRTSLVSALWLDDGRLLVGAVTPQTLEDAALDPTAAP